ncbi:SRPBCC family protein [Nocardia uniformis]|uniref:SRPBCC family protein n=1 Tax=Nocardia uniformis TaxID=53432 RepID=A0A849C3M2_9NOCA|nr:SRPBCC family protein [Nocardia uniformis]NNH70935.1 SRPBCC family protein [Nocardia uniformis]
MVSISSTAVIERPVGQVFAYFIDYDRAPEWAFGLKHFKPINGIEYQVGAVYEGLVDLGPKTLRSTAEVIGWEADRLIAFKSLAGFGFSSALRFSPEGENHTRLDLEAKAEGGAVAQAVARTLEPLILMALRYSTERLRQACLRATDAPQSDQE